MIQNHDNTKGYAEVLTMLTEFTILNKLLDLLASKINGSLTRPIVLLSFTCVLIHGNTER
jgi:hypothetical protein